MDRAEFVAKKIALDILTQQRGKEPWLDEMLQSGRFQKVAQHIALVIHILSDGRNVLDCTVRDLHLITGWSQDNIANALAELDGVASITGPIAPAEKVGGSRKAHLRELTIEAFGHRCSYCQKMGTETSGPDRRAWCLDRIIPGVAGGRYEESNVTLSCWACNARRGADSIGHRVFSLADWRALRREWKDVGAALDMEVRHG
jgi:hypothetical protein